MLRGHDPSGPATARRIQLDSPRRSLMKQCAELGDVVPTGLDLFEDASARVQLTAHDADTDTIVMMAKSGSGQDAQKRTKPR